MNDQKKLLASCFPHLQGIDGRGQMGSGLLRHVRALAHDWGQVLMFEGKSCSHFRSFTRKGLEEALAFLRPGDTFIVWKLDRAGRSLRHLMELLGTLQARDISFVSLTEQIDTTTPSGKLIFHLLGALSEFERDLIRERTNAGLAAARARGNVGGRPRKLQSNAKVALARHMFASKSHTIQEICSTLGISRATLYRYVKKVESAT